MIDVLKKGIYTKLNTTSAVTTLLSSATAIHYTQAKAGSPLPYIIFTFAGGSDDGDTLLDSADFMYYIKGVANTAQEAGQIAAAIRDALHNQTFNLDDGWSVYHCQQKELISQVENVDRSQYHHRGASYRIRISQ